MLAHLTVWWRAIKITLSHTLKSSFRYYSQIFPFIIAKMTTWTDVYPRYNDVCLVRPLLASPNNEKISGNRSLHSEPIWKENDFSMWNKSLVNFSKPIPNLDIDSWKWRISLHLRPSEVHNKIWSSIGQSNEKFVKN